MSRAKKIDSDQLRRVKNVHKDGQRSVIVAETETLALVDKAGKTRGKNPRDITFKVLNRLPKTIKEFMGLFPDAPEADICQYLYDGYNENSYSAASDEIGEFIPEGWDKDTEAQFRLAVRNFSKVANMSIEDAVKLILPGTLKAVEAKKEAAKVAATSEPATATA